MCQIKEKLIRVIEKEEEKKLHLKIVTVKVQPTYICTNYVCMYIKPQIRGLNSMHAIKRVFGLKFWVFSLGFKQSQ